MKWSIKIGRYLGIDVFLHFTFVLLLGLVFVLYGASGGLPNAIEGVLFFLALFLCVLLHEFGHALMARKYGIKTRDITLLPIGGVARLERIPEKPLQELWVALAGPAVNVIIAAGLALGLFLTGSLPSLSAILSMSGSLAHRLLAVNLLLVAFNLLPAFPMDGGRVLRAWLAVHMNYARATRIAAVAGKTMAILFAVASLFGNPMLLFIALFVWMGATQEVGMAEMKSSLSGVSARSAMMTDFRWLSADDTLARAADMLIAGWQQDFPVVDNGRVAGFLTRNDLIKGLSSVGPGARVGDVMRRQVASIREDERLDASVFRHGIPETPLVHVVRDGRLVGLLTMENLAEFLMIQNAIGNRCGVKEPRVLPPPLPPVGESPKRERPG